MRFKVYSGDPAVLEAGFAPHLEAEFKTKKQADDYVATWVALYPSGTPHFWVEER